jgi:hypothetical protein
MSDESGPEVDEYGQLASSEGMPGTSATESDGAGSDELEYQDWNPDGGVEVSSMQPLLGWVELELARSRDAVEASGGSVTRAYQRGRVRAFGEVLRHMEVLYDE